MAFFAFTFNYNKNMFPGYTAWRDLHTCLGNTWITRHPHETPPPRQRFMACLQQKTFNNTKKRPSGRL
jgi:hypothetical protein